MMIFKVCIVIESGFIFATVITFHQFSPAQLEAMMQLIALSPSQVRTLCKLALTCLESDGRYSVDSRVLIL
jgi:hypothetical protein